MLQQHISRIHADIGQHRCDTRYLFAVDDCGLHRGSSAILRQKTAVNVYASVFRNFKVFP